MSLTVDVNKLKFTIFASGHDYTLADSGDGEVQVFSHPFVPLGSAMYAGQWYFLVPDENGDPMDAVKDDMAHCTFTPALGSTFDTEGEVTVECHYHREYIYDEETLVVDKTVSQKITVVNHGSIVIYAGDYWGTYYCSDVYSDGYMFLHPKNTNNLDLVTYCQPWYNERLGGTPVTKISSFYWRVENLGAGSSPSFLNNLGADFEDIDELRYADVSKVTTMRGFMGGSNKVVDLEPLTDWDISNVTSLASLVSNCTNLKSLKGLEKWNTSKVTSLANAFYGCAQITDWSAISKWDTSKVTSLSYTFASSSLTDMTGLKDWDTSEVVSIESAFRGIGATSLHGLENWNVSKVENMIETFYHVPLGTIAELILWTPKPTSLVSCFEQCGLTSLHGLENFDTSGLTTMRGCFRYNGQLTSADGLETWDVSACQDFREAFYGLHWLSDTSAFADWNTASAVYFDQMFYFTASILNVSNFDWDYSNVSSMGGMFAGFLKYYSPKIGKEVYQDAYYYWDYDGRRYIHAEVEDEDYPMSVYSKSASGAESWNVSGSGLNAFDDKWNNVPSWN